MNTFEAFGLTLPLSALLYLGLALLIACCVLAGVMGAKVGEQQVKESIDRALPPLPQRPHVHDWTTARALDEDQRDACCLCGQRREKSFDEHAAEALAMVACHPAANDSLDIADMALNADELVFAAEVLADIDDQPTYAEGAE